MKNFWNKIKAMFVAVKNAMSLKAAVTVVLVAAALVGGYAASVRVDYAVRQSDKAIAIASATADSLNNVSDHVDVIEQSVAEIEGKNASQDLQLKAVGEYLSVVNEVTADINKTACDAKAIAEAAVAREKLRVKAESQNFKRMLSYIRGANPMSGLCVKSATEVDRLLASGDWSLKNKIQAEYDTLISAAADQTKTTAEVLKKTEAKVDATAATATQALDAGTTAISAVQIIAEQPNKTFGKSVNADSKRVISAKYKAYFQQYGTDK